MTLLDGTGHVQGRRIDRPEALGPRTGGGAVGSALALVGQLDRRAVAAVSVASAVGGAVACHVLEPGEDEATFAERWFGLQSQAVPIDLLESCGTVADTIVADLEERARDGRLPEVLVIGALHLPHWWQRLMHDGTGDQIANRVRAVVDVEVVVATIDPSARWTYS